MHQILDKRMDIVLTEQMLIETDRRLVEDKRPGSRARSSNSFLGSVAETAFAAMHYGDFRMVRTDRVSGRVDFPMIEVKASRHPALMASYMMAEVGAAQKVNAIVFVSAVIGVSAGDEVQAGMVCRFFGWEWRPFFIGGGSGGLKRYHNQHATIEVNKELVQPIWTLAKELAAFKLEFLRRQGRNYEDDERPPEWLYEFACKRLGIGIQGGLYGDGEPEAA